MTMKSKIGDDRGFSIIELLIVVLIIAIMAVATIIVFGGKDLYHADQQAYLLMDAFKEARQRALTQQETIRVEVSKEKREIRVINENEPGDAGDDTLIKRIPLAEVKDLTFHIPPSNITAGPVEPTPVPPAGFNTSLHPMSQSEQVATLRFLKNGNVVNEGSNAVGDNSVVTGATFYFWKPKVINRAITNNGSIIRAITVLGSSGNSGYWKCAVNADGQCSDWTR